MRTTSLPTVRYSPARQAVFRLLLGSPQKWWSVADMVAALPAEARSAETVRATLYVLASAGVLNTQDAGGRLLFRLTERGGPRLRSIMAAWRR